MEVETSSGPAPEHHWKTLFSDLSSAGLLSGRTPAPAETPGTPLGIVRIPLTLTADGASSLLLTAAWSIVLARHTAAADVIFYAAPRAGEKTLAPLRVTVDPKMTVAAWLPMLAATLQRAEKAGPLPGHYLTREREEGLDRAAPTFLIAAPGALREPGKSRLTAIARMEEGVLELHYAAGWFDEAEVRAIGEHVNVVLRALPDAHETPLGRLPLLTEAEQRKILVEWNQTAAPFAETTCIHQFFEQQAARTPSAIAAIFCDRAWTYRELDAQAERIALRLRRAGVGRGTFVAVAVPRSLELMATLLGVLKAGGAYVPLDPAYPAERLHFMIEDARPAVIVVTKATAEAFAQTSARLLFVDAEETLPATGSAATEVVTTDPAYVLYTSGSTGKPKGVVVTHRNVANFFTAMDRVVGPEPGVWLAVTSVNFDISVFELFWTLARGFRVVIQEEGPWGSASGSKYALPQQIERHGVTHLQCTPSLASMLLSDAASVAAIRRLRRFVVGGEPLPLDLARRLAAQVDGELWNLYGPTETTVWSAAERVPRDVARVLIGRPVANNRLYVLDAEGEPAPIGTSGELYIGGDGLAIGYLNRPDITAERFVVHDFAPGQSERLYRTGDVVRQLPDGRIEFMGRSDNQIKLRGVRIELGEIELALREHAEIRDAVVVLVEDAATDKRLVAYVIAKGATPPAVADVQRWLAGKLPKAVIPSSIQFLAEFPKTPNGKLDRRALPKPDPKGAPAVELDAATPLERQVAAIWCETLGVGTVGLDDRFFDVGGHSLLLVEVHDKLRDKAGYTVPLLDLFKYPTVRSLAQHLRLFAPQGKDGRTATGKLRGNLRLQSIARQGLARKPNSAGNSP
jgi:amino acid adenylation domain-containing protein